MRPGDEIELTCGGLDAEGRGLATVDQIDLHVLSALPGERVVATIDHVSGHVRTGRQDGWATTKTLLTTSGDRVAPACPGFGTCGGCVVQHLSYKAQIAWKHARVAAALAASPALAEVPVAPCMPSPRQLEYRNQAKYVYGHTRDGRLALGAYAPRSHDLVDLAGCRVLEQPLDAVAGSLREILAGAQVPPFDEQRRTGRLRYVVLRANAGGQVLATLICARREWRQARQVATALRQAHPEVVGVVQNVNSSAGNALFGNEEILLEGSATLDDAIAGVRVRLSPRSFFQINRYVAALAYEAIRAAAAQLPHVHLAIDAYSGAGGIALTLAAVAGEVVGLEENAAAAEDARASTIGFAHQTRFLTGDVAQLLAGMAAKTPAGVVVLNPPRAGCAPEVLQALAQMNPRPRLVAYLSCDLSTLTRDLDRLTATGFATRSVQPFDMLPHTPHIEALALIQPVT